MITQPFFQLIIGQFIFFTTSNYLLVEVEENKSNERPLSLELKDSNVPQNYEKYGNFDKLQMGIRKAAEATNKQDNKKQRCVRQVNEESGLPILDIQDTFISRGINYLEKFYFYGYQRQCLRHQIQLIT